MKWQQSLVALSMALPGLALADGSLQQLLESHPMFSDAFKKANLKGRTVIRIDSPNLPAAFHKIDKKWWYDPSR